MHPIYCPPPLQHAGVQFEVDWPDGWDELGIVAEYHFGFRTDLQMDGGGPATKWVDGVYIRLLADGTGEIEWPGSTRPRTAGTENVAFDPRDGELPCGKYELNNIILRLEVQGGRPPDLGAREAIVQPRGTNDVALGLPENVRPEMSFEVTVAGGNEIVLPIPRALCEGMDEVLDRLAQR
jgi:hypothetical protein